MRWVRYKADHKISYGILEHDEVEEVTGSPFDTYMQTGKRRRLDSVKLLVPVVPPTFYALGHNYEAHIRDRAAAAGSEPSIPTKPMLGYRANNALIAHKEPIVKPKDSGEEFQYEGELVVVIGKRAKHLSEEEAFSCILGYTIGNDVSERTWQASDSTMWRSKNTDTFKPMGPWIETDANPAEMWTTVHLNDKITSEFETNNMLFGIATCISTLTRYNTLHPGDTIWMGTDGATDNMKPGDVCEINISGIGILKNPVVLGD